MFENPPDLLIIPSDLVHFSKTIDGCVCINPGTVCKANGGGSYGVITVEAVVVPKIGDD
jgi:DNA polymerase alpha subunit B